MPAIYSYYQIYKNLGQLHLKTFLEFEIEYSTYRILNRSELCGCSLTAGNYLLSYMNINYGNAPEARDGYFTT